MKAGDNIIVFDAAGDFRALNAARAWLHDQGYSVGRLQRGAPCGVLRGDYDIQKWRNLSAIDRRALDGILTGNFRDGPVAVRFYSLPATAALQPQAETPRSPPRP